MVGVVGAWVVGEGVVGEGYLSLSGFVLLLRFSFGQESRSLARCILQS